MEMRQLQRWCWSIDVAKQERICSSLAPSSRNGAFFEGLVDEEGPVEEA